MEIETQRSSLSFKTKEPRLLISFFYAPQNLVHGWPGPIFSEQKPPIQSGWGKNQVQNEGGLVFVNIN